MSSPETGREPVLIWGASGHGRVVADIVRREGRYTLAGFIDDDPKWARLPGGDAGREIVGVPFLGNSARLPALRQQGLLNILIAVGQCAVRGRLASQAEKLGMKLVRALHPQAAIAGDVQIGRGTVVMAGAVINVGSILGKNVIINTGATVDHDCRLADNVHISPGAHLGGTVTVGAGTWIGIGAAVRNNLSIGQNSVIGAGAVVVQNIPDNVVAFGLPAKIIRPHEVA